MFFHKVLTIITGPGPQSGSGRSLTLLLFLPLGKLQTALPLSWLVSFYILTTYRCITTTGGRKGSNTPLSLCLRIKVFLNSDKGLPVRRGRMSRAHPKILSHSMAPWWDQETSPQTSQYNWLYLVHIRLNLYLGLSISCSSFNHWYLQVIFWLLPCLSHFSLTSQVLCSYSASSTQPQDHLLPSWTTDFLLKERTQVTPDPSCSPYSTYCHPQTWSKLSAWTLLGMNGP